MTAIEPLRRRHTLQLSEPAAGFASRLAAVNGRPMNMFLRDMLIPPRSIDLGDREQVEVLARIGGADPAELLRCTPYPHAKTGFHYLAGEVIGYRAINRTYFRYCPFCLSEDLEIFPGPDHARPWLRLEWTVRHFRSCSRHGVYLRSAAPVRRRFEPFDFSETVEELLPTLAEARSGAMQAPPSRYQAWLRSRLNGESTGGDWLAELPFYAAAEWCEALGVSILHPPKVRTAQFTEQDWATAADAGFWVATGGESRIQAALEQMNQTQKETRGFWGLRDTYGFFYGFLQKTVGDEAYEQIRTLVRDFANCTIPIEPGTDVLGVSIDSPGVATVRTIARATGAHDVTVRRLMKRKGLAEDALSDGLRNHRVTVSTEEIATVVSKLKGALSGPQVSKRYGIPRTHLDALIAIGALPTVTASEQVAYAKHRFAIADVETMMSSLFDGTEEVLDPTSRQLPIRETRHAAGTSLHSVLSMVFARKLKWSGRQAGRSDYSALLLDADEVTALVRSEPPMSNYRKSESADAIAGMTPLAIGPLLAAGLLKTTMEFSPDARRLIPAVTRKSVNSFRTRFVCLGELATNAGLHHKQINLLLRGAGIDPVMDPSVAKVWFFNRSAVEAATDRDPYFWQYDKAEAQALLSSK